MCLAGGFLLGFFAAGGVLQLVTAVANEMFPKNRGVITSIVMIASSAANYIGREHRRRADPRGRHRGSPAGAGVQHGGDAGGHSCWLCT